MGSGSSRALDGFKPESGTITCVFTRPYWLLWETVCGGARRSWGPGRGAGCAGGEKQVDHGHASTVTSIAKSLSLAFRDTAGYGPRFPSQPSLSNHRKLVSLSPFKQILSFPRSG